MVCEYQMTVLLVFGGFVLFFTTIVVVSKLRLSNVLGIGLSALVYTALGTFLWIVLWASGAGLVTPSIVVALMLATFVPAFEWVRRRS